MQQQDNKEEGRAKGKSEGLPIYSIKEMYKEN